MSEAAATYHERLSHAEAEATRLARHDNWFARARTIVFLLAAASLAFAWLGEAGRPWFVAGAVGMASFVGLAGYHEHIRRERHARQIRARINRQCLARLARSWSELPANAMELFDQDAAIAVDLDLFGAESLFQLLNRADSQVGQSMLRDWLLRPATPKEIQDRQHAARALAPCVELREEFNLHGHLLAGSPSGPAKFIAWAESEPWLGRRPWLVWASRLVPLFGIAVLLLVLAARITPTAAGWSLVAMLVMNAAISVLFTGRVHDIFNAVATRRGEVEHYVRMFELMYKIPDSTRRLANIKNEVTLQDGSTLNRLRQLNRIIRCGRLSHDSILFLLYLLLQLAFSWDFHVLVCLERWQQRHGKFVRRWFDALGEFEALASLAALAHDHPDWCFPSVDRQHDRVRGSHVGHPLLTEVERVVNDVEVGPAGHFLLVTGSNMSGKSTLLRSLGINAVLAQAGAPVCATKWEMPPLAVATSMRISDSLQDHVSFFMAELTRLKQIVDQSRVQCESDGHLLFLLDEILQGTNSTERHIAVVEVLAHLLKNQALGAVSTHDLELAKSDLLAVSCTPVHFRETIHGHGAEERMTFDYKLRPGIAPTTNALKLLELVGLRERASDDR